MTGTRALVALAIVSVLAVGSTAVGQECPCNCYFSGDCEPGNFCNWGNLPEEDSCFWRTPKPQGNPGAGCQDDYNNWGQCDGICAPTAAQWYPDESTDNLVEGLSFWSEALSRAAGTGGGYPDADLVRAVREIPFGKPEMADGMWRIVAEVLMITRGEVLVFPDAEQFHSEQVQVTDLSSDPELIELGNLAIAALIAEVDTPGAGRPYVDMIANRGLEGRLPESTMNLICRDGLAGLDCLYVRLSDMGDALGGHSADDERENGGAAAGGCDGPPPPPPPPPACGGDANLDDWVDVEDLVMVIQAWNGHVKEGTPADVNGDQSVDVADIVMVIQNWGPCD